MRQSYVQRVSENITRGRAPSPKQRIAINGWVGFVEATSIAWLDQRSIDDELPKSLVGKVLRRQLQVDQ